MIQRGNDGYILHTSSGVMKLGPTRKLRASGRLDDEYFKKLDMEVKNKSHLGIVVSNWNDRFSNTRLLSLKSDMKFKGKTI